MAGGEDMTDNQLGTTLPILLFCTFIEIPVIWNHYQTLVVLIIQLCVMDFLVYVHGWQSS